MDHLREMFRQELGLIKAASTLSSVMEGCRQEDLSLMKAW
jgi:hypothetical protein